MSKSPVIVALDFAEPDAAVELAGRLDPDACRIKVGQELFTRAGPRIVEALVERGFAVFLDLKFHDIPNTVAQACRAAAALGVWMLNVHAGGGSAMMQAAREGVAGTRGPPLLVAVTVLTSLNEADLAAIGLAGSPAEAALRLARLAQAAGLDGVVCSALEARLLKSALGADFRLVTPGIRPAGSDAGDQKRVMTAKRALAAGADYLVIGRPITRAPDPRAALAAINASIGVHIGGEP